MLPTSNNNVTDGQRVMFTSGSTQVFDANLHWSKADLLYEKNNNLFNVITWYEFWRILYDRLLCAYEDDIFTSTQADIMLFSGGTRLFMLIWGL